MWYSLYGGSHLCIFPKFWLTGFLLRQFSYKRCLTFPNLKSKENISSMWDMSHSHNPLISHRNYFPHSLPTLNTLSLLNMGAHTEHTIYRKHVFSAQINPDDNFNCIRSLCLMTLLNHNVIVWLCLCWHNVYKTWRCSEVPFHYI